MNKKNNYADIDATATMPVLNLHNEDAESSNNTAILRFDLERVAASGDWSPIQHHAEAEQNPERLTALRDELALVRKQLARLQVTYESLEHQHARHELSHHALQLRHDLLIANQGDLQTRLATAVKTATHARAENSKNLKHIAKLLKRIIEQQVQLSRLNTSHE